MMTCFLCNKNNFAKKYSLPNGLILMCQTCGIYIKETSSRQTEKLYDDNYYDAYPYSNTFGLNRRYFKNKINMIKKLTGEKEPYILDIGCGWGDFLEVAKGEGLPYFGVDHSPAAIKKCKEKKLNVANITIDELLNKIKTKPGAKISVLNDLGGPSRSAGWEGTHWSEKRDAKRQLFDAIVSFQTIEHLLEPVEFLTKARQFLKPGGIILLTTPNNDSPTRFLARGKWSVYNIPSHFMFYNKKTLQMLLKKARFKNITIRTDPPRFFLLNYLLQKIGAKKLETVGGATGGGPKQRAVYRALIGTRERQDPRLPFLNLPIPTDPFGDLEVIATI